MKTSQDLQKEIQLLIHIYQAKLAFPQTLKMSQQLVSFPFLYEFIKNIQIQFQNVSVGKSKKECRKEEHDVLKSLKDLLLIIKIILGKDVVKKSDWLKKRRKNKKKFFRELITHLHKLDVKNKDFVCHWMEKGFAGYERDINILEDLENNRTSRADYDLLLTLRQALWGNIRCLGFTKAEVERMLVKKIGG